MVLQKRWSFIRVVPQRRSSTIHCQIWRMSFKKWSDQGERWIAEVSDYRGSTVHHSIVIVSQKMVLLAKMPDCRGVRLQRFQCTRLSLIISCHMR